MRKSTETETTCAAGVAATSAASRRSGAEAVATVAAADAAAPHATNKSAKQEPPLPIETVLPPPSLLSRHCCTSILLAIFAIWGKFAFIDEADVPGGRAEIHSWRVPLSATIFYLISLPILTYLTRKFLRNSVDVKLLLRESMILYNAGQVVLNAWTVYRIIHALLYRNHPFIGGPVNLVETGASYAVWIHYCDKYLEFLDTYFMVLRGKMDQVRSPGVLNYS